MKQVWVRKEIPMCPAQQWAKQQGTSGWRETASVTLLFIVMSDQRKEEEKEGHDASEWEASWGYTLIIIALPLDNSWKALLGATVN